MTSVHPNTLAHSLLLNAEELVASKPRHTPVALTLPDKKIVSSGDVDDVIRQMTKRAPRHGLIVLYTTTAGEIWVQAA